MRSNMIMITWTMMDYDEHLCDYCGDNYTSSRYCSGWCKYRAEVRAPMKRETMKNIIQNLPAFEEKKRLEAEQAEKEKLEAEQAEKEKLEKVEDK
jgi:hypothetical protein